MKTYGEYINDRKLDEHLSAICELIVFQDLDVRDFDRIDEVAVVSKQVDKINPYLEKLGVKLTYRKTLIHHAMEAGKGVSKMLLMALKGDSEGVKKLAKSVNRNDVANFVLRLDKATLNIIGGTVNRIEAITGWKLSPIKTKSVAKAVDLVKKAINVIKEYLPFMSSHPNTDKKKVVELEKTISYREK